MKYTVYKEITKWDEAPNTPNHSYIFNEKRQLVGYIKTGTKEMVMFSKPMLTWSSRGRKMVKLRTFTA